MSELEPAPNLLSTLTAMRLAPLATPKVALPMVPAQCVPGCDVCERKYGRAGQQRYIVTERQSCSQTVERECEMCVVK